MNYERVERSVAIERTRRISRTFFQKQHIFKFDRVNSFGKLNNKLYGNDLMIKESKHGEKNFVCIKLS